MKTLQYITTISVVVAFLTTPWARADEGIYGGIDLLFLAPKISNQGVNRIFYYGDLPTVTGEDGSISSDLEFAQRLYVGYEGDGGAGVQVRWFTFDNELNYVGQVQNGSLISLAGAVNLDVDAIDAELVQNGDFSNWEWRGTAGVRWGRVRNREIAINFEDVPDFVWAGSTGVEFDGAGPTFSVLGQRPICFDGLSLFASGRTALLYGNIDVWSAFNAAGRYAIQNEFVQVWEFQAGLRCEKEFDAFDLVSGIFWEAQRWDSDSGFLGDLGFHGFGVRAGIEY